MDFLDLPEELVLVPLLKNLNDPSDIRSLRLTCKKLCALMDDWVGIKVALNFDDDKNKDPDKLAFLSSIGIQAAMFNMLNTRCNKGFSLWEPTLLHSALFSGITSSSTLLKILKEWKALKGCFISGDIEGTLNGQSEIALPSMFELFLKMKLQPSSGLDVADLKNQTRNVLVLLHNLKTPGLRFFCTKMILWGDPHITEITRTLFDFLKSKTNLKGLFLLCRWHPLAVDKNTKINTDTALKKEMKLLGQRMDKLKECLISFNQSADPWIPFLLEQRKLIRLGITDDRGLNKWGPLEMGVRNNAGSLKAVYIASRFNSEDRLNFSSFSGCSGLKELALTNLSLNYIPGGGGPDPNPNARDNFDNFHITQYCPNLEFVLLANITISKRKIRNILDLKKLTHLVLLSTSGIGNLPVEQIHPNGVDLPLLKSLVTKGFQGLLLQGVVIRTLEEAAETFSLIRKNSSKPVEDTGKLLLDMGEKRRWTRGDGPYGFVFDIDFLKY